MKVRLAKHEDAGALAKLHLLCARDLAGGFETGLGYAYLKRYYQVLLSEKSSVVLCAEDEHLGVIGIASGSLDYFGEHEAWLKKHRGALLLSAIPAIVRSPRLVGIIRKRLTERDHAEVQVNQHVSFHSRFMFWGWHPEAKYAGGALMLMQRWLALMRLLGSQRIQFEVDDTNKRVIQIHRLLGAQLIQTVTTAGRGTRHIMEYSMGDSV